MSERVVNAAGYEIHCVKRYACQYPNCLCVTEAAYEAGKRPQVSFDAGLRAAGAVFGTLYADRKYQKGERIRIQGIAPYPDGEHADGEYEVLDWTENEDGSVTYALKKIDGN